MSYGAYYSPRNSFYHWNERQGRLLDQQQALAQNQFAQQAGLQAWNTFVGVKPKRKLKEVYDAARMSAKERKRKK